MAFYLPRLSLPGATEEPQEGVQDPSVEFHIRHIPYVILKMSSFAAQT